MRIGKTFGVGLSLTTLAFLGRGGSVAQAGAMTPIYDPYSNSDLYIVGSNSSTWPEAQTQAQALGGNLVTIHSATENQFVANAFYQDFTSSGGPNLSNAYALWIGLYDPTGIVQDDGPGGSNSQHAADFTWVDGETASYRNWNAGEPNDGYFEGSQGAYEDYTTMYGPDATPINVGNGSPAAPTGTWNDAPNNAGVGQLGTTGFYGFAEVPVPEPAALSLVVLSALGLLRRRMRETDHAR